MAGSLLFTRDAADVLDFGPREAGDVRAQAEAHHVGVLVDVRRDLEQSQQTNVT